MTGERATAFDARSAAWIAVARIAPAMSTCEVIDLARGLERFFLGCPLDHIDYRRELIVDVAGRGRLCAAEIIRSAELVDRYLRGTPQDA